MVAINDANQGPGIIHFYPTSNATLNGPGSIGTALRFQRGSTAFADLYLRSGGTTDMLFRSGTMGGAISAWRMVLHSGNTMVDANGFIKAASPIARVGGGAYASQGFAAAGDGAVNADAAGVTIARTGPGLYRMEGSLGLAQSGWQIEVPKDHNGNRLVHVETGWTGGVLTLTVTVPLWQDGLWIVGAPMDVPEGRWVDVRLHKEPDAEEDAA